MSALSACHTTHSHHLSASSTRTSSHAPHLRRCHSPLRLRVACCVERTAASSRLSAMPQSKTQQVEQALGARRMLLSHSFRGVPPLLGPQHLEADTHPPGACQRAFDDGVRTQRVELLLPLIGATDLDDWPGGIRQMFKSASPLVERLLRGLKASDRLAGRLDAEILDQGDAICLWTSPTLACALFPTGATLKQIRAAVDARPEGLVLLVNPQWQPGQAVSDFGLGPWRRRAETLVGSFQEVYHLRQLRIQGDSVALLRCYPEDWHLYLEPQPNKWECIHTQASKPTYEEMKALLVKTEGSNSGKNIFARLRSEYAFIKDSVKQR